MVNKYYQKAKKCFEKKHVKYIKIFLKDKKKKGENSPETDIKIFLKKKKKKEIWVYEKLQFSTYLHR